MNPSKEMQKSPPKYQFPTNATGKRGELRRPNFGGHNSYSGQKAKKKGKSRSLYEVASRRSTTTTYY